VPVDSFIGTQTWPFFYLLSVAASRYDSGIFKAELVFFFTEKNYYPSSRI
jgi:hypothetical protein